MRGLTRYVLFDLLKVFLITLAGMTLIMILAGVGQEAVRQGLGLGPIFRLIPFILPEAMRFAVPATVLLATCTVFGRMGADNEIVALKSLGISPTVVIAPALSLAFVLSLISVWLNDVAVSWGSRGVHRVVVESVEQIAYGMLRTHRSYSTSRFSINVKSVDERRLLRPTLTFHAQGDAPAVTLTAREAELRRNLQDGTLSVFLTDGTIDVGGQARAFFPDTIERVIPLTDATRKGDISRGPSHCPLRLIRSERFDQRHEIERIEQSLAAESAFSMLTGDFDSLVGQPIAGGQAQLHDAQCRLYRLRAEPWRRWANGFSCFFFVLVGAPLAMHRRSANFFNTFAVVFMPILIIYYPLLALGIDRAKSGAVPPYTVWLGNVVLLAVGFALLRKVIRY